jgi:hypothetical protein
MRIAFTIIFNGLHHLHHNNQYNKILKSCDKWIVVEGASESNGSTSWCKEISNKYHKNGGSTDGTREFLTCLSKKTDKIVYVPSNGFWESKDAQVNRAIQEVKKITNSCWLWEIDADEQWSVESMKQAELELKTSGNVAACFRSVCKIGRNLQAIGEWGEARTYGYTRLWNWNGEEFACHEPPVLRGTEGTDPILLSPTFTHYNYYFENDVEFKDSWYGGHEGILDRWKLLTSLDKKFFPMHISNLITGEWGKTNSALVFV